MKAMRHLAALGGALCALMAASGADARPIGTVVGVPSWELNRFVQVNTFPPFGEPANNVTVLHVSPEFNAAIVTVALTRRGTGLPAASFYVPSFGTDEIARIWRQINAADAWSLGRQVSSSYGNVLKVLVNQPYAGNYTPGLTRFLIVPADALAEVVGANPQAGLRRVHRQWAHIGGGDLAVELLAMEGARNLQIPEHVYGVSLARQIAGLNRNVSLRAVASTSNGAMGLILVQ
jgi:hypothetical protein